MKEYRNSQIESVINEYIHSARDRQLLKSRYIDGLTFEKIAEKYDLSVRRAKEIVYRYENTIDKHL